MCRRRNPTIGIDALSGGNTEEIARGVLGLRLEYYDGFDWYDTWGDTERNGKAQARTRQQPNLTGMPDAVRITLWLDADSSVKIDPEIPREKRPPPLAFQTIVRVNLASASSAATPAGNPANPGDAANPGVQGQPTGGAAGIEF